MPRFAANPDAYVANIPELPPLKEPDALASAAAALEAGKTGSKLVVLLFADKSAKTTAFVKILSEPPLGPDGFAKVAYAKVEFDKDSEDAKKWKVTAAPALLLLDASGAEPKLVKTLKSGSAASIKKEFDDAAKKLGK